MKVLVVLAAVVAIAYGQLPGCSKLKFIYNNIIYQVH